MEKNTISVSHLRKQFAVSGSATVVLKDITATFLSGTTYAITGISGSGKSTLLNLIAGFEEPTQGTVCFDEVSLRFFSPAQRYQYLQHTLGFLFQKPYFIKELSVFENVMLPAQIAGYNDDEARIRAIELLAVVGLTAYGDAKPGVLSGGQQQRLCLARALCNKPLFLCADEPTAGLDAGHRADILELMRYGVDSWGMGIIVATHDMVVAQSMDHVLSLADGVLVSAS